MRYNVPETEIYRHEGRRLTAPFVILFRIAATLLSVTLASEGFFHPLFFAGFQVEGVAFDFLDDVLLLYFPLEAAQGIFKGFAVLHDNFRHINIHLLTGRATLC